MESLAIVDLPGGDNFRDVTNIFVEAAAGTFELSSVQFMFNLHLYFRDGAGGLDPEGRFHLAGCYECV
jgi:hypothetical protein